MFSFLKRKKVNQVTPASVNELEQTETLSNIDPIEENEDIPIEEEIVDIVTPENEIIIEEENVQSIVSKEVVEDYDPTKDLTNYQYPNIDLLKSYKPLNVDVEEVEATKDKIMSILQTSGIDIISIEASFGYVNTLYEIVPKPGFRVSKIKQLKEDLAFALLAPQLSVELIVERGIIGIVVPNKSFEILPLHSLVSSTEFQESEFELPIALGKTIKLENIIVDLTKQPHMFIGGATGQGKSVLLNNLILSLLFKKHPSELKFVLIDTHIVEFNLYSRIEKHYLAVLPTSKQSIISDIVEAQKTLQSVCVEMSDRFELLQRSKTKNILSYNNDFKKRKLNPNKGHRFLPYIVVVIDEYLDFAIVSNKQIENSLIQLTRKAHIVGIHIILATQRPSKNIISGDLKANFPIQIAFKTSDTFESKMIIDGKGAEELSGRGDALYREGMNIKRIQVPYVFTEEIENMTNFIGVQHGYESSYQLPEIIDLSSDYDRLNHDSNERDVLFEEAARLIVIHQQGSTSLIQRKFTIGYNRAGRLMDQLEASGIVSPVQGSNPRDVYVPDEYTLEKLLDSLR